MAVAAFHILLIMVMIYLLAIVTEAYFVEALDEIARRWELPEHVAGASLMAMGSSAPELAIAIFALFREGGAHADVGIGTIVGSAIFNILVIPGASALVRPIDVGVRVMLRDSIFYLASVALLVWAIQDGQIEVLEAVALLALYGSYIFVLFRSRGQQGKDAPQAPEQQREETDPEPSEKAHSDDESSQSFVSKWICRGLGWLGGDPVENPYRTFFVSIACIAGACWFLVDSALIFSETVGIPPVVVALTILAAGTSIPDLISSMIVAKQGRGEMAVSNAVGSNIFDILIGLGLPWIIALTLLSRQVAVDNNGLWTSTILLLGTVLLLTGLVALGRGLGRAKGALLVAVYAGYVLWVFLGNGG
jgi:K+-dependent Na+/Ca+ exchanger-like protein